MVHREIVSTGQGVRVDPVDRVPDYDPRSGDHLWIVTTAHRVDPEHWASPDPTVLPMLDHENLLSVAGPGCFYCEQGLHAVSGQTSMCRRAPMTTPQFPNTCRTLGPFYMTTVRQADNAPIIDVCGTRSVDGWSGGGFVIRFRKKGRALVVGRMGWRAPVPSARLRMTPIVGALFRMR